MPETRKPVRSDEPQIDPTKPTLAGFDAWLRKRGILGMGVVIATAFLAKTLAPLHSFTLGLGLGVVVLVGLYLWSFHHAKGNS